MATTTNEDAWRPDCSDLGFEDEQFVVGKGESRKVFHVHRNVILACGSPVFQELLSEDLTEEKRSILEAEDPKAFELLMNHLYGKHERFSTLSAVWNLFIIGAKYKLPNILHSGKECINLIELSEDDFWDVIDCGLFSHPLFYDKIHDCLKEQTEKLIYSEKFFNAPKKFIEELLQMDELNIDEYGLLSAVTEWAYRNIEQANSENLKKLFKHIRFGTLKYREFSDFIQCYPEAIDKRSTDDIREYLRNIAIPNLPEWCSSNHVFRRNSFLLQKRLQLQNEDFSVDNQDA